MTTPNVYGRTTPMTADERAAFDDSVKVLEKRSPQLAQSARQWWDRVVALIGEESPR